MSKFKLSGSEGDGRHPYANMEGAFLGHGVPLFERDALGRWGARDRSVLEKLVAAGYGAPIDLAWRYPKRVPVANALNQGDLAMASISLVQMRLPPLTRAGAGAMAQADGRIVKYNEPRVPAGDPAGGQWTSDGGGAGTEPAADRGDDTQAKNLRVLWDKHCARVAGGLWIFRGQSLDW